MRQVNDILIEVSQKGMRVDVSKLSSYDEQLSRELAPLKLAIPFNPNSNKDLGVYVFEKLGFKPGKKGKTGPSVAMEIIQPIYDQCKDEILGKVIEAKKKIKTLGMITRLLEDTVTATIHGEIVSRVHTHFTFDCSSGRIYTEKPSLQLMPMECRECIIPDEEHMFIQADYVQNELRILAVASGDVILLKAISRNEDLHTTVVWEMMPELKGRELSDAQRMLGKVLNYGIVYGMDSLGIARTLGVSQEEGQRLLEMYLDKFEGVSKWLKNQAEEIMKVGYSETLISKTRYAIDYNNADQEKELRRAINHIIQGTAADILKIAIQQIDATLPGILRMLTHDAMLVECKIENLPAVSSLLEHTMELAGKAYLQNAELTYGKNWREAMGK